MIELKNVSAGYGKHAVLHDISVSFRPGELTVLLGPNGSGKSTLIRTVLALQDRLSGQITVDGEDSSTMSNGALARKMTYMAQSRPTPNITARKMVLHGRFPYLSYPRKYRREDYDAARRAMDRADCIDLSERSLPELSGGQRQKVYLAMALCQDTKTVFMDEPTTYLDVEHQLGVMKTARMMADEGKAVVLVLHDLCLAMSCADRILLLNDGSLLCDGTPEEVYASGMIDRVFNIAFRRIETDTGMHYYYENQK